MNHPWGWSIAHLKCRVTQIFRRASEKIRQIQHLGTVGADLSGVVDAPGLWLIHNLFLGRWNSISAIYLLGGDHVLSSSKFSTKLQDGAQQQPHHQTLQTITVRIIHCQLSTVTSFAGDPTARPVLAASDPTAVAAIHQAGQPATRWKRSHQSLKELPVLGARS